MFLVDGCTIVYVLNFFDISGWTGVALGSSALLSYHSKSFPGGMLPMGPRWLSAPLNTVRDPVAPHVKTSPLTNLPLYFGVIS